MCCSSRALRLAARSRLWGSNPLHRECVEELPFVADTEAPAAGHEVVDIPAKEKDRDHGTEQRKRDPDPHAFLLFSAGHLHGTPFTECRLHARRGGSMQIEIAEDPRHWTTLVGGARRTSLITAVEAVQFAGCGCAA
jgi:hypothetical protein